MSNHRVTITLGRSGQVVERRGSVSDTAKVRGDGRLASGSKRSMADRLGSNVHGLSFSASKRQRGDGKKQSGGDNRLNDSRISRNDLRLKLLRKRLSRQNEERKPMNPHVKLSKPVHSSLRYQMQHKSETNGSNLMRQQIPPPRESADALYQVNSGRKFHPSQTTDGFRARSPDIFLKTSMGLSPPRKSSQLQPISSFRQVDASRAGQSLRNGMVGSSQPMESLVFTTRANPQAARPVTQFGPASGGMQGSSHMGDEGLTVAGLLHRLGLGKYAIIFQAEEVDMTALKQMGDKDLKELGIPMGPRKKIILALLARNKRQPP